MCSPYRKVAFLAGRREAGTSSRRTSSVWQSARMRSPATLQASTKSVYSIRESDEIVAYAASTSSQRAALWNSSKVCSGEFRAYSVSGILHAGEQHPPTSAARDSKAIIRCIARGSRFRTSIS